MDFSDIVSFKLVEDGRGLLSLRLQLHDTPFSHLYEQWADETRSAFVTRCFTDARVQRSAIQPVRLKEAA